MSFIYKYVATVTFSYEFYTDRVFKINLPAPLVAPVAILVQPL